MGILDAPASPKPYRPSLFGGLPIVTTRCQGSQLNVSNNLSNGTDTDFDDRHAFTFVVDATDIRLVFGNFYNGATAGPSTLTVKASIELPNVAAYSNTGQTGSRFGVTFKGSRTVVIEPGAWAVSDPVPIIGYRDQIMYVRTHGSVPSGGKWPRDLYTVSTNWESYETNATGTDKANSATVIAQNNAPGYTPHAILGVPTTGRPKVWALNGDSIGYGSGDFTSNGLGFLARAFQSAKVGYISLCMPGEKGTDYVASSLPGGNYRSVLAAGCTHFVDQYGRNDWGNGISLATLQAAKIVLWRWYLARNVPGYTTTGKPGANSTDGWTSTANQTPLAGESVRVAYNAWVRDRCPLNVSTWTAATVGTPSSATVKRAGESGHPLVGYFEIADLVESARDSGFWKVGPLRTVNDAAIGNVGATLTSATAAFTTADIGKVVALNGAGAAGAPLVATILGVTNATTASLNTNSSAAVSGASCMIGDIYTADGIHPTMVGHVAASAGVLASAIQ